MLGRKRKKQNDSCSEDEGPAKKKAELFSGISFRKALKEDNAISAIKDFLSLCKSGDVQTVVLQYLEAGGGALELLELLQSEHKNSMAAIVPVFSALQYIIMSTVTDAQKYRASTEEACKHLLSHHLLTIHDMLSLKKGTAKHRRIVLKLLAVSMRIVKQLKVFYDGYKRQCKKNYASEKVNLYRTGGGPPITAKNDDTSNKLLSIIKEQVEPANNLKDSDASFHNDELVPEMAEDVGFHMLAVNALQLQSDGGDNEVTLDLPVVYSVRASGNANLEQEADEVEPQATPSWMVRNRPSSVKRKKPESVAARKKICMLAENRNNG